MYKLLNAGFARMFRSRAFLLSVTASFVIFFCNLADISAMYIEDAIFRTLPTSMFIAAIFIVRFAAAEYEANAIRNKIIVGNTKLNIVLSNFVICAVGSLIICAVSMLSVLLPLYFRGVRRWYSGAGKILLCLAGAVFAVVALAAMLSALSLLISKAARNTVVCILLVIGLVAANDFIGSKLDETETLKVLDEEESVEYESILKDSFEQARYYYDEHAETIPNPGYISGNERVVLQFLENINPISQAETLKNPYVAEPLMQMPYMAGLAAVTTFFGIIVFRRKNIS